MGTRVFKMLACALLCACRSLYAQGTGVTPEAPRVLINEVVTDPQQDWGDTSGGNGVPFDSLPGDGTVSSSDEWIELFNAGAQAVDLTSGAGWSIEIVDTTPDTLNFLSTGSTELVFSNGGSLSNFQPGEYLVVGNPPGSINNDVYLVLRDAAGAVADNVEIGDDFQGDGPGDGAPDGGSSDGNAAGVLDETVARFPDAADTDSDIGDFVKQAATIGASNGAFPDTPATIVINEVVTDPQRDWSDNEAGNGVPFDDVPGAGSVTTSDEWVELYNAGPEAVNLVLGDAWRLEFIDGSDAVLDFATAGTAVLRFSAGGSVSYFQPGEYLVIGNPPGSMNNDVFLVLRDPTGAVADDVEIGDDFEGDGPGDGAPDGGASDGNATAVEDEAVARLPNAGDTEDDVLDFAKQAATIGGPNDEPVQLLVPDIAVSPASHDFGEVHVDSSSSQGFNLTNEGTADLLISDVTVVGPDSDAFILSGIGAALSVPPGDSHPFTLVFSPTSPGLKTAAVRFASNDPDEPSLGVPVSGSGGVESGCKLSVAPTGWDFGGVPVTTSVEKTLILANANAAGTNCAGSSALQGDGPFEILSGADFDLEPGGSHRLAVGFDCREQIPSRFQAELVISSSSGDGSIRIPLTGECQVAKAPDIASSRNKLRFGRSAVGSTAELSLDISNQGNGPLEVSGSEIHGSNANQYAVLGAEIPFVLAPGENRSVRVIFHPTSVGLKLAHLRLSSNDPDEKIFNVFFSGTGVDQGVPELEVDHTRLDFGPTRVGKQRLKRLTVTNRGEDGLHLGGVELAGRDEESWRIARLDVPTIVGPGKSFVIAVIFRPFSAGRKNGVLRLRGKNHVWTFEVPLMGEGTVSGTRGLTTSDKKVRFGPVPVGQTSHRTFRISNQGKAKWVVRRAQLRGSGADHYALMIEEGPFVLGPGEAREISVDFRPTSVGRKNAHVRFFTDGASDGQDNVFLSGRGTPALETSRQPESGRLKDRRAEVAVLPETFRLLQNYPNPFNAETLIAFTLPSASSVELSVYNMRGVLVRRWDLGTLAAGEHRVLWDGTDSGGGPVGSGVYVYRIAAGSHVASRRLVLIK